MCRVKWCGYMNVEMTDWIKRYMAMEAEGLIDLRFCVPPDIK